MSKIQHEFNYATWPAATRLSLVRVPWDNAYMNVCKFEDRKALDRWIDSQETPDATIKGTSYAPVNRPIRINLPFNKVQKYNYIRASNPAMPLGGDEQRNWYYFIVDIRYIAPSTTEIIVQMDYFQCYAYDLQITQGYVERGHILNAASNRAINNGRDYLAVAEGWEIGSEYRQVAKRTDEIMGMDASSGAFDYKYDVLVVSTIDLMADDYGNVDDPKKPNATGTIFEGLSHGASFYVFEGPFAFTSWMQTEMKDKPWITQGIMSITVIPKLNRYMPGYEYGDPIKHANGYTPMPRLLAMYPNWRNSPEILDAIPARYRRFADKLMTWPYMAIEMTTWSATPVIMKPESWNNADAVIMERSTFTPPNQRLEFMPRDYNSRAGADKENYANIPDSVLAGLPGGLDGPIAAMWRDKGDDMGEYLDMVTRVTSFPTMAILNDAATLYMAGNAHGIATQFSQNNWAQQKAFAGNRMAGANTQREIDAAQRLGTIGRNSDLAATNIGNNLARDSWALGAIGGAAQSAIGGAIAGGAGMAGGAALGAAGAVTGAMHTDMTTAAASAQQANRSKSSQAAQDVSTELSQAVSDNNRFLADYVARGDFSQGRAAIMARIQDAQLLPPSTAGQMGGEAMNLVHHTMEVSLRWKLIDEAHIAKIGEYWLRYGYAVERFIRGFPKDMHAMTKFTFWKLSETMTNNAPVPEFARAVFRGIHEKGVTYWRRPEDIGSIDFADNAPVEGISI